MAEELQKAHLFYDDINKIRVLEASVLKETEDLKETCKDYESSKFMENKYSTKAGLLRREYLPYLLVG